MTHRLRAAPLVVLAALFTAVMLPAAAPAPAARPGMDPGWPRVIEKNGNILLYYQPQIDSWKDYKEVAARIAFALTPAGGKESLGVLSFHAKTVVDADARTVVVQDIEVDGVRSASLDEASVKKLEDALRERFPKNLTVHLDRFLAVVEASALNASARPPVQLKNDPPPIYTATGPAVLLYVDGEPALVPIEGTQLKYVANTNWDLFRDDASSHFYLLNGTTWLTADKLDGEWRATTELPPDMSKLPAGQNFDDVKKNVPPHGTPQPAKVFYTAKPAEIITFKGQPEWAEIPGTHLVYAKNSENDVFIDKDARHYYYVVSGRWFRATSLDGPWSYAGADLPKDFAKIPPKGPKGNVLASVPGTQEAADAVLLARTPTRVTVNRAEAEKAVKINYAGGEPKFQPIEGTSLSYAVNSQEKVIKLGDAYYACFEGVWFVSSTPNGPWKTCDKVPDEIYTIPPSSPLYNVTYVTMSDPTEETVEASYTDGYTGEYVSEVSGSFSVYFGTGWYYPPYYWYYPYYGYPIWYPWPCAWGYGAWYNSATGRYGAGGVVYGPYGMAGGAAVYNPATGAYGRFATVQTPWGGRTWASGYNPYTGVAAARSGGWSPYGSWGSTAVTRGGDWAVSNRISNSQGTVRRTTTSGGASMTKIRTSGGETIRVGQDANNNVYAGKDGNVYRRDQSGNWSKYENGSWNPVNTARPSDRPAGEGISQRPSTGSPDARPATRDSGFGSGSSGSSFGGSSDVMKDLNRDASSRARGSDRATSYGSAPRSFGGGFRGGGGGRRR